MMIMFRRFEIRITIHIMMSEEKIYATVITTLARKLISQFQTEYSFGIIIIYFLLFTWNF